MKRILIVDDDADILLVVSMLLRHNHFIVKTISNCSNIFETIKMFLPNLILLDISLGSADGREICKQIKQSVETRDIPVILFSAQPDLINYISGYLSNGSVSKPFETPALLETIRKNIA
jgi:DNA-binding response OmpR family regulator